VLKLRKRAGTEYICEIPDGAAWTTLPDGSLLVAGDGKPLFVMHKDDAGKWVRKDVTIAVE
jgi:hypothetical protein